MILQALGQAGFLIDAGGVRILVDPYLSESVAEKYGAHLRRRFPAPVSPGELVDIDWICLTHADLDHTDPATLAPLAAASPAARFLAPAPARAVLDEMGWTHREIHPPPEEWQSLGREIAVRAIPAAHTELKRETDGECRYVGYLFRIGGVTLYHAGDTIPHPEIFASLQGECIDYALLPINERNYYRDEAGIVGNMTVREAFQMAMDLGVKTLIPIHWDLFAPNTTHVEEIELLYRLEAPSFSLEILPPGTEKFIDEVAV